jgi:hypothetical protein
MGITDDQSFREILLQEGQGGTVVQTVRPESGGGYLLSIITGGAMDSTTLHHQVKSLKTDSAQLFMDVRSESPTAALEVYGLIKEGFDALAGGIDDLAVAPRAPDGLDAEQEGPKKILVRDLVHLSEDSRGSAKPYSTIMLQFIHRVALDPTRQDQAALAFRKAIGEGATTSVLLVMARGQLGKMSGVFLACTCMAANCTPTFCTPPRQGGDVLPEAAAPQCSRVGR